MKLDPDIHIVKHLVFFEKSGVTLSYGPPWAHYLGGYRDRQLGGPLGLPGLRYTAPDGVDTRITEEKYSVRKPYKSCAVWKTPRRT
jgi:hypothetical protein